MTKQQFISKNLKALQTISGASFKDLMAMELEDLEAIMSQEIPDSASYEENVYLNLELVLPDGRSARITGVRLDSDFVQFTDKEHTKPNVVAQSLLKTIEAKGVQHANEHAQFKVTVTKQGESSIELTDNLF